MDFQYHRGDHRSKQDSHDEANDCDEGDWGPVAAREQAGAYPDGGAGVRTPEDAAKNGADDAAGEECSPHAPAGTSDDGDRNGFRFSGFDLDWLVGFICKTLGHGM